jgi:hypothetical protein
VSRDRRRDVVIDRLLRAALQPGAAAASVGCPDAERLSAFLEGALEPGERRVLEAHFADCERCQQALALVGRMSPVSSAAAGRRWWWPGGMRWLVPAATTAVVCIAVYVALRPQPGERRLPLPAGIPTEQRGTIPSVRSQPETAATQTADERRAKTPAARARPDTPPPVSPPPVGETAGPGRRRGAATPSPAEPSEALLGRDVVAKKVEEAPAAAPAAASRPAAPEREKTETFADEPAAPAMEAIGTEADAVRQETKAQSRVGENLVPVGARSPDGASIWRFGRAGAVAYSPDGGRTWTHAASRLPAEVLAASSPAAGVCWAAGRNGGVSLVVGDGRWLPRLFPERVDLVAIVARDAHEATVTTRDGRRYATADGGATWTPVP